MAALAGVADEPARVSGPTADDRCDRPGWPAATGLAAHAAHAADRFFGRFVTGAGATSVAVAPHMGAAVAQ